MATKVITGKVRASFVHIFEPQSVNGSEPKYSCSFIIPKSDTRTVEKIRAAIENAKKESLSKWGGKIPPNLKLPLRDGDIDRPDDPNYANAYFVNANSNERPGVVDRRRVPITDPLEVYSGCYVRASITFYPFNTNGNRGVACGLQNIQKWCDGEPLNGRVRAEDEFDALDGMPSEDYVEPTYAIENANRFDDEAFGSDAPGLLFVYDVNENGAVVRYYYDDGTPIESLTHNETTWYQQIALRGGLIEVLDINTAAYYDLETMDLVFETYLGYEAD